MSSANGIIYLNSGDYKDQWVHFAICRSSGTTTVYKNGTSVNSISDTNNYTGSDDLVIGNESIRSTDAAFGGDMTYFHWMKGVAKYTSNFTVSNTYPNITSNTVLLITETGNYGTLADSIDNENVQFAESGPPDFDFTPPTPPPPPTPTEPPRPWLPLFTNNAQVYYKPGSLASCGVGSVRNSSVKSRRI